MVFKDVFLKDFLFNSFLIFQQEGQLDIGLVVFLIFFIFSVPAYQHLLRLFIFFLSKQQGCPNIIQAYLAPHPNLLLHHTFLLSSYPLDSNLLSSMVGSFPHLN